MPPLQAQLEEYQVKAAFLFHFAQLVDWPSGSLGSENSPLILCTAGENALSGILEVLVQGKEIRSHPLQVRHLREKDNQAACHLLFIVGTDKKHAAAILTGVNNAPILTIGESDNFIQQGGIIGFCLQENKICFDINLETANRAHLKISSRLLLLARSVIGNGKQG